MLPVCEDEVLLMTDGARLEVEGGMAGALEDNE